MSRIDFVTGAPERHMPLVEALGGLPDRLEAVLAGHSTSELQAAPADGEWPAARAIGHMISYARHNHGFLYRVVWMADPIRQRWDEPAEAETERWEQRDGAELLTQLREVIGETVDLLSETPDASWGRPGITGGMRRSLRQVVVAHTGHLDGHLHHIEELLAAKTPA
jgi:hypothetical protein